MKIVTNILLRSGAPDTGRGRRQAVIAAGVALVAVCALPAPARAIVGGSEAASGAFPSTVSVYQDQGSGAEYHCGGVIISKRTVLTAAHCTSGLSPSTLSVRFGSNDRTSGGTVVAVSQIVNHPSYSSSTLNNDVAVVNTAAPMDAPAAPLPAQGSDPKPLTGLTVTGWGKTSADSSTLPVMLHQVGTRVVARSVCQASYGNSAVTANMFCAGLHLTPRGACTGDDGSPAYNNGVVLGVVSQESPGCDSLLKPDIYTRIGNYRTWIGNNMIP
ncbi:serine protease [Streptomyces spectabilis]|uniref:S1 family serine peptidase n=1 Tax=Streptomyces spectabilis TaxID=68270 RepID=UPI0033C49DCC